jgi:hypothetical protein
MKEDSAGQENIFAVEVRIFRLDWNLTLAVREASLKTQESQR